jgi:hypothetical protein
MLTAVALVSLLGWSALLAAIIAHVVDGLERRRLGRVVGEIAVTEAVHGVLGAIVAPTVARRRGQPWTVTIGLAPRNLAFAGRLTEIAQQVLMPQQQRLASITSHRRHPGADDRPA